MSNKVIIGLGILGAVGLTCCFGTLFLGKGAFESAAKSVSQAQDYSDQSIKKVAAKWDRAEFLKVLDPKLTKNPKELDEWIDIFKKKLGPLKSLGKSKMINFRSGKGVGSYQSGTFATFSTPATFEKGEGTVNTRVVVSDGKYILDTFKVDSKALFK